MFMAQSKRHLTLLFLSLALVACSQDTRTGDSAAVEIDKTHAIAGTGYRKINRDNDDDLLNAQIFELENGLRVYLTENHEQPRFYAEIVVKAGSKNDPATATGLAHYLEHLLFKGNQNLGTLDYAAEKPYLDQITELYEQHFNETDADARNEIYAQINRVSQLAAQYAIPNEIDKLYNSMGAGGLNAHTYHEETVYKVGLPSNRLQQWAAIESNRFVNPVFRLFHTELETVYEEKNRSLDSRGRIVSTALNNLLYKDHPYGQQPTIGTTEHLKNPSLKLIQNYFDTWYVPNNMAIFISGDIDIAETIRVISQAFSGWESKPVPEPGQWDEAPLAGAERATVTYPGEELVHLAFRTVDNSHEDVEALMLFDMILDNRTAGLINLNLNQAQRVRQAGSSPEFLNDYGSQNLWGIPKQEQTLEQVEELLLEQVALIQNGEFEDWIIPAIVNDFKKNQKGSLESNVARVSNMRTAFLSNTAWDHHVAGMNRLEQVSKQEIIDVANKYFGENYVAIYRLDDQNEIPSVEKPRIDPVNIDPSRQSQFATQILAMDYEDIQPTYVELDKDYRIIEFADGVQLYYASNPLNDLFSFSISVEVGTEENDRLSLANALINKSGTAELSNEELQKQWYRMGSDFGLRAGESSSIISISGLDEQFEPTLQLMLDLVHKPTVSEQTLEELKGIIIKSRQDRKNSPRAISSALTLFNRYGDESPMLESLTNEEIRNTSLEELQSLVGGLLDYKHTLSYTGSMPLEDLVAVLRRHHTVTGELKDTPPYRLRRARQVDETEIYVVDRKTAQAQVRIEFPDNTYDESLVIPASIYNSYFGTGMSGVVFQELREARALAYSTSARYSQGGRENAENMLAGSIGTQTDKTVEALAAFIDLLDNMPESSDRFDAATTSLMNRYRTSKTSFRGVIGAARSWERLGLDGDPRKQRFETLQSTSMEDLLRFQREHVKGRAKLISIVGDLSIIDLEALAQFGKVTQIEVDELFVE